ncbi:MAG: hypothetical protein AAF581_19045 [Planctomycetota bacterium]
MDLSTRFDQPRVAAANSWSAVFSRPVALTGQRCQRRRVNGFVLPEAAASLRRMNETAQGPSDKIVFATRSTEQMLLVRETFADACVPFRLFDYTTGGTGMQYLFEVARHDFEAAQALLEDLPVSHETDLVPLKDRPTTQRERFWSGVALSVGLTIVVVGALRSC